MIAPKFVLMRTARIIEKGEMEEGVLWVGNSEVRELVEIAHEVFEEGQSIQGALLLSVVKGRGKIEDYFRLLLFLRAILLYDQWGQRTLDDYNVKPSQEIARFLRRAASTKAAQSGRSMRTAGFH